MSIKGRILKVEEAIVPSEEQSERSKRWLAAYSEIAATMSEEDFTAVHAELIAYYARGDGWNYSRLSFVAARVLSLVERTANGFNVGLLMPPALVGAWREHDLKLANAPTDERFNGSFRNSERAECGAEHPQLGCYERRHSDAKRWHLVLVNEDEVIKTCLACGGCIGKYRPAQTVGSATH